MRLVIVLTAVSFLACVASQSQIVCYYPNWSTYRLGDGKYEPSDIDPTLCTQVIYAFAVLDTGTLLMKSHDPQVDLDDNGGRGYYKKVTGLKKSNPKLKVLLAIGGWTDSHDGNKYSRMVATAASRAKFISEATKYVKKYGFDGLDLDWEYPGAGDKANFATFVKELKNAFTADNLMVTIAVAAAAWQTEQSYDIPSLSRDLDQIHLMAYDYHGSWESTVNHHAPLYSSDQLNDDTTVGLWLQKGTPASKLFLGCLCMGKAGHWQTVGKQVLAQQLQGHQNLDNILEKEDRWPIMRFVAKVGPYAHGPYAHLQNGTLRSWRWPVGGL